MAQTSTAIAILALERLGVKPEEQAAEAPETIKAVGGVTLAHAELAHHSIAFWSVDDCPDGLADAFADYVAGVIAVSLVGEERAPFFHARMPGAMRRMAAVAATRDLSDAPVKFEDF